MILRLFWFLVLLTIYHGCKAPEGEFYDLLLLNARIIDVEEGTVSGPLLIAITSDTIRIVAENSDSSKYKAHDQIDLENKFVMPGLWDMHVHFRGGDSLIEENQRLLPLFMLYGVTTVRDAGGDIVSSVFNWRRDITNGSLFGPTIFSCGPKLDGADPMWEGSLVVESESEVVPAIDSLESLEVDFVKLYDGSISKEMFYALVEEAEGRGLRTTGHVPFEADLIQAKELGLDGLEHMFSLIRHGTKQGDSISQLNLDYFKKVELMYENFDSTTCREFLAELGRSAFYVTPTLYIGKVLDEVITVDHSLDSLLPFIGNGIESTYQGRVESAKSTTPEQNELIHGIEETFRTLIVPMYEADISILAGSDCGPYNSFVYPGESLIAELNLMVTSGLSPREALETSVINGPKFMGLGKYYGDLSPGKVADILVLEHDPLVDIENISSLSAVIKKSRVYHREDLRNRLLPSSDKKIQ